MVHCMAMLPDGRLLSGSADEDMRLWDVDSGECCRTLKVRIPAAHLCRVVLLNEGHNRRHTYMVDSINPFDSARFG